MDTSAVKSLHGLVEESVFEYEEKLAVLYDDGKVQEFLTYKQLWSAATMVRYSFEGGFIFSLLHYFKHIKDMNSIFGMFMES